MKTATRWY